MCVLYATLCAGCAMVCVLVSYVYIVCHRVQCRVSYATLCAGPWNRWGEVASLRCKNIAPVFIESVKFHFVLQQYHRRTNGHLCRRGGEGVESKPQIQIQIQIRIQIQIPVLTGRGGGCVATSCRRRTCRNLHTGRLISPSPANIELISQLYIDAEIQLIREWQKSAIKWIDLTIISDIWWIIWYMSAQIEWLRA